MCRQSWSGRRVVQIVVLGCALAVHPVPGQGLTATDRGAATLRHLVDGITVTGRVLVVGVHPDDDDPLLIATLARGHNVQTAYLSLTRGESGENFLGDVSGSSLGAIRTGELLAARRIDGGESYFTRAIDFGFARTADEALKHWPHDSLLGDVVTVIRSFRPQVIVGGFPERFSDGNGQHDLLVPILREAFDAAADSARFPVPRYGPTWSPAKWYRQGGALRIDASGYDAVLGKTYVEIATESRGQHRSEGLLSLASAIRTATSIQLQRVMSRVGDSTTTETSIFDGVDTSFARLASGPPPEIANALASVRATADSARRALDLSRPALIVPQLARIADLAAFIRRTTAWCGHPSRDAAASLKRPPACDQHLADLDAAIDIVLRRANDALLDAAGVIVEATAQRELFPMTGGTPVGFTITNHGHDSITVVDVDAAGTIHRELASSLVEPESTFRSFVVVSNLPEPRPWWFGNHQGDLYPNTPSAPNGLGHPMDAPSLVTLPGVAIPEELRRSSDASITLEISGATITTSIGPVTYRSASPQLGLQDRPVAGVPAVTMSFQHGLEWVSTSKPIDRRIRLALRSFSTAPRTLKLQVLAPAGLKLDTLPSAITLEPFEQKDVFLHVRGNLKPGRYEFGVRGVSQTGEVFIDGFQSIELPHIDPVYLFHSSALYLQAVNVNVPPTLVVAYVEGVGDASSSALRQIGLPFVYDVSADDIGQLDLSRFAAVVVGPRAYEAHPSLLAQNGRLLEFARNGGTLVVLNGQYVTTSRSALAYPAVLSSPVPEHVTQPDAPVTVLDPRARVLNWPNKITAEDWEDWIRERALFVPTEADSHYARIVEMHDVGQRENRNAILVAPLGKGTYVYSTLTFYEQIPGGVPGALRLFVNLLSAGCKPGAVPPAKC